MQRVTIGRVFVGLSGGVDSAVSAALLREQGHDVTGVFIKIWSPEFLECTWKEDRLDAMRVAVALGIPFREIDLSAEYKKNVVEQMVGDYARGITPNPDVLCNRAIKFGAFAEWAFREGADTIATGHYARIDKSQGGFRLLRGRDASKDQSYFLYRLEQDDLRRVMFPVGAHEKKEVRAMAERFELPVAKRPDSQGLCFVGDVSMREFLGRFITLATGPVLDTKGSVVGEHDGAALYTLGQRHGFRLSSQAPKQDPMYITHIATKRNAIIVSPREKDARTPECELRDVHWIGAPARDIEATVRYRAKTVSAIFDGKKIRFKEPQIASPGQSVVMYQGDVCLGGGIIA